MVRIYVEQVSERLLYVLDFVLKDRGLEYSVTNDELSFLESGGARLNYSEYALPGITHLRPASVLFDEDIRQYRIEKATFQGEECLSFDGVDDPLAAVFYVLSRYEEYIFSGTDEHDRFDMSQSVQVRFGWLEKVICDRWAESFVHFLRASSGFQLETVRLNLRVVPTFDIDNTYAHLLKEGPRRWGAVLKDYVKGDRERLAERKKVTAGIERDPYDTYALIEAIADSGFPVLIFWLLGDYRNFDRNVTFRDPRHQRLIRRMSNKCSIGIHPSYRSNENAFLLGTEKARLEEILGESVTCSRQHFLKLSLPSTYQRLITAGIRNDYTMGMADRIGFRAGTARSFFWFDLAKNSSTALRIHPFAYMDGTLNEYLHLTPEVSKQKISELFNEVRQFGGNFTFIWHNETINDRGKWTGWKDVLEYTLKLQEDE
jgi:hypothetical protein